MKKRKLFKGLCMTIAFAMLSAVLPMGVMAKEIPESVTIRAEYDTYVRDYNGTSGSYRDTSYNGDDLLYATARGGNNKYTLIGFNLGLLKKNGYEVDTAKITLAVNGYKRANGDNKVDTGAHSFSVYSLGNIDYTSNPGQTFNSAFNGKEKVYISSTVIAPEGTIAQKDKYEFDVSSYFDGLQEYTDDYIFAIYPDAITDEEKGLSISNVDATFFALDNGVENYSPSLTVTYKAVEKETEKTVTIKAEADTYIRQAGGDNTNKEANRNFGGNESLWSTEGGNSLYDNEVWTRFDLSETVPSGWEISDAKVRFYATNTVKCQSYATYNYLAMNLYSISAEWSEKELTYAIAYPNVSVAGTAAFTNRRTDEVKVAEAKVTGEVLEAGKTLQVNDWIEFDITEYLKGKTTLSKENFVMLPLNNNDSIYFHSKEYNGGEYAPYIVITCKEKEPEIKTVTINTEADTYIRQGGGKNEEGSVAKEKFGNKKELFSTEGGNSRWDNEVWTRFDLSGAVPAGSEFLDAKVRFYATEAVKYASYETNGYLAMNLYSISAEWSEEELTYASAYPDVDVAYTAAFTNRRTDEVKVAEAKVTGEVSGSKLLANDWIEFDITQYLKGKTTLSKESFVMLPKNNDSIYFHSKEYNVGEYAPQIVITYIEPEEPEVEITKPENYDYSFAVIGDTEALVEANPQYLAKTYDWLIENADEEKLKFVFGLGDVTSSNDNMDWAIYRAVTQKLDNVIPYSVVRGEKDNVTKFKSAFPYADFESVISGTYDGTMLNTYRFLPVNGIKYLIFTLDYGASDDVLAWAGRIIENNIDSNVIITTHAYLGKDGTILDSNDTNAPSASGAGYNDGDDMWDKLVKNHKNIVLVLSGHDSSNKIVYTQSNGVYGNKVNQLLINPETLDEEFGGLGLVAMLYFSEDGKKVDVRYYSTVRNEYYKAVNQFSFDMNVIASSITPTTPPVTQTGAISFDVDLTANEYEGKVVAALYDKAYNLISVSVYDAKRTINVSFPENVTGDFATVYWLKDFETIIPVCAPETLNIAE